MNWLPLITVSVQVTLVAAVGLLTASLLRSAAHRHSVLLAAMLFILAGPIIYAAAAWAGIDRLAKRSPFGSGEPCRSDR